MANNHVLDPTYFFPAIELFSFNYNAYIRTSYTLDSLGNRTDVFTHQIIRGSLQSQGSRLVQSEQGNRWAHVYKFYCKSFYRLDINDVIEYKNKALFCVDVQDYDEYGCRECTLEATDITGYKDLAEYMKYQQGVELV